MEAICRSVSRSAPAGGHQVWLFFFRGSIVNYSRERECAESRDLCLLGLVAGRSGHTHVRSPRLALRTHPPSGATHTYYALLPTLARRTRNFQRSARYTYNARLLHFLKERALAAWRAIRTCEADRVDQKLRIRRSKPLPWALQYCAQESRP